MPAHFDIRSLLSRRALAATSLFLAAFVVVATRPGLFGHQAGVAVRGVEDARPIWIWVAASCFVAALVASSWAWRAALALCGGMFSRSDAAARFSVGCLVNSFSPVRVGEVVRIALFARGLDGGNRAWRMGGVFGVITALRAVVFGILVACAIALEAVPLWPLLIVGALVGTAGLVAVVARDRTPRTHVAHVLDAFRAIGRSPGCGTRIAAWITVATAARFVAATAIAAALGVRSPLTAALIIVPALDVAGLIPLSGNVGITSGAIAVALHGDGVGMSQALATGLAFHAVETAAGISFGTAGALLLGGRRRVLVVTAVGATACVAAAFCATVILPLA